VRNRLDNPRKTDIQRARALWRLNRGAVDIIGRWGKGHAGKQVKQPLFFGPGPEVFIDRGPDVTTAFTVDWERGRSLPRRVT
jgi:hypothetical protein